MKKRVAFVIHKLSGGGAERVVIRLLRRFDREKFLPLLIVLEKKGVFLENLPGDVPILDCGRYAEGGRWGWLRNFVLHLRRERPDAIVGFLWFVNGLAVVSRFLSGTPSRLVLSERSTVIGSGEGKLVELIRRAVIIFLYPAADRIVPNSRALARQLVDRFGISPRKVTVIPNPVDIEEIAAQGAEEADPGVGREALPVVAGMGRLSREKGFDLLIRAAAEIRSPFRMVLMGEGPEEKSLRDLAARLGVSDRVRFTGFLRNPYASLARAEVFVLPSRYEGFPNGLVEAMALGLPCVATRCPTGPEEILTDGADGLLVPVEDPGALAAAIERLLGDPALRERLGRAARERVRAYDAPGIVRRFEALIEEVAG
jgi:glycosyltransferase involved in cell wall biosynthesis